MTLSYKLAKLMIEKNLSADEVVETLRKYKLLGLLPTIRDIAVQMSSLKSAGDTITIEAPFALSEEAIMHIKKMTGNVTVKHEVTINKNILAGFRARWKGKLYDGSAERIIKQLTK